MPDTTRPLIRATFFVLLAAFSAVPPALAQKQPEARQVSIPIRIAWKEQRGVKRYRLQVARDRTFTDVVFDRLVVGLEHTINDLSPGNYVWRVAPAAGETGAFTEAVAVDVGRPASTNQSTASGTQPISSRTTVSNRSTSMSLSNTGSATTGWRTATGSIAQPLAAPLRGTNSFDLVGVNADGMVYALDGANGVALWTARFRPQAKRGELTGNGGAQPFIPIIINERGASNVVVAFDGGVRALEGATGRELWRATVPGRGASGIAADLDGDAQLEVAILSDGTPTLTVLNAANGRTISQTSLDVRPTGPPAYYNHRNTRGVILGLEGDVIDVRGGKGQRLVSIKLDAGVTTPPHFVQTSGGGLIMIGTERGLIALEAGELKPLWRVATDEDAPQGRLVSADMDQDGVQEVVMITRRGRAVVVNTSNGKIKWYANGASDAATAAFADLDSDGVLDVLVAANPAFAMGLSGRDGTMLWKIEEDARRAPVQSEQQSARALVTTSVQSDGSAFLIGSDPSRAGLRAVGLPKGSVKTAMP
jgi:outer membrane protein assembly factor BamB